MFDTLLSTKQNILGDIEMMGVLHPDNIDTDQEEDGGSEKCWKVSNLSNVSNVSMCLV